MHVGLGPCVGPALRAAITRLAGGLRLARFLAALTPTFDTDRIEPLRDQLRAGVELPAGLDVLGVFIVQNARCDLNRWLGCRPISEIPIVLLLGQDTTRPCHHSLLSLQE